MKTIISVVGPTGIGKTNLAIALARHFDTEIISCDSRQFYREMRIGTAAPSEEELSQAVHHFIGHLSVTEAYSIGRYEEEASALISQLLARHDVLIMVGGSMMYEKAVLEGLHDLPEMNAENQLILKEIWDQNGYEALLAELKIKDETYYNTVDRNNPRRILRALDVIRQTGKPYSALISQPKQRKDFNVIRIGIGAPRELIYQRINQRVETMLESGLLNEVKNLVDFQHLNALHTVGYTELFRHLRGEYTLDFAISEIKKNTRRFAKRQLTWYRGEETIQWVAYGNAFQESLSLLRQLLP